MSIIMGALIVPDATIQKERSSQLRACIVIYARVVVIPSEQIHRFAFRII